MKDIITTPYSDIIIRFSDRKVFAHKAILAASSLYFHRAFSSGFAVASNSEIDLGDDDDPVQTEVMLRIMYDDHDDDNAYGLLRDFDDPNATKTYLDYYVLGDKYDVPVLCEQAKELFISEIQGHVYLRVHHGAWESEFYNNMANGIAMVLGPSALTFGDKSIQEETLKWCARHLNELLWHRSFRKLLSRGQMFSREFAGRFLLVKARLEHVELGWDLDDDDVYNTSSSEDDSTPSELESEPEAEEHANENDAENDDDDDDDSTRV
ncbi:hypothetical protein E4T44_05462 [Aureobasidium sp. EXF-8845]|nr:hypothetical protein E4T44_05462 [Aureobasidium sp. EXF-8845]KAI4850672.1 hypothetical protein E4T45_05400 [Aureobasidium sp. EXF-8846]